MNLRLDLWHETHRAGEEIAFDSNGVGAPSLDRSSDARRGMRRPNGWRLRDATLEVNVFRDGDAAWDGTVLPPVPPPTRH